MTFTPFAESAFSRRVRGGTRRMKLMGAALLILGIVALIFPEFATVVATLYAGWVLLIAGVTTIFGASSMRGTGPFFGELLFGVLSLASGVFLLLRPGLGMVALTMTVGVLFLIQGAAEFFLAFKARPSRGWGWMLFSAIASIVLGFLILAHWPGSSLVALGVLMGVNFITSGVAYLSVARSVRRTAFLA